MMGKPRKGYSTHLCKLESVDSVGIKRYRNGIITAARELCYGESVIAELKAANTRWEMSQIMERARRKYLR